MGRVSVTEAAKALGVGNRRVLERIDAGSLPAERIGRQWTVDEADLAALKYHVAPGRPLSERSAWALIAVAADDDAALARVSPPERSRARARLRALVDNVTAAGLDEGAALLATAMGKRATRETFQASQRDLPDVREDPRVRLSGLSRDESNMSSNDLVEGYVTTDDLDDLASRYLLTPANRHTANVILHVTGPSTGGILTADVLASPLLRAADLAEHLGVRERNEAFEAMKELSPHTFARRGERPGARDA